MKSDKEILIQTGEILQKNLTISARARLEVIFIRALWPYSEPAPSLSANDILQLLALAVQLSPGERSDDRCRQP